HASARPVSVDSPPGGHGAVGDGDGEDAAGGRVALGRFAVQQVPQGVGGVGAGGDLLAGHACGHEGTHVGAHRCGVHQVGGGPPGLAAAFVFALVFGVRFSAFGAAAACLVAGDGAVFAGHQAASPLVWSAVGGGGT